MRAKPRWALAKSEDQRISFEAHLLPKASVVEQPHSPAELGTEGFEQPAAMRSGCLYG